MQRGLSSSCLFGSRFACAQPAIFFAKPYSINAGETLNVLWIAARRYKIPSFRNPNQNRGDLWRIFSSNVSAPANRKTGFYANREPNILQTSRRLDPFSHEAAQNFELLSNIQDKKLKIKNR
jgi:hypothetical protein